MSKTISKTQYIAAQGMFYMAKMHGGKCDEYRKALCEHLGVDESGHISDVIYGFEHETLDEALERENISVESA